MEAAISSIEVEVSSAAWAWLWAPWVMSLALAEIWPAEDATWTDASWMLSTMLAAGSPTISLQADGEGADLVARSAARAAP